MIDDDDLLIFLAPPIDDDPLESPDVDQPSVARRPADAPELRWRKTWARRAVVAHFAAYPTTFLGLALIWTGVLAMPGLIVLFGGALPFAYCVYRAVGGGPPGVQWRSKP